MADIERRNVFLVKPIYSGITEGLSPTPGAPSFSLSVILSVLKNVSGPSLYVVPAICSGVCCHRERGVDIVQSRRRGRMSSSTCCGEIMNHKENYIWVHCAFVVVTLERKFTEIGPFTLVAFTLQGLMHRSHILTLPPSVYVHLHSRNRLFTLIPSQSVQCCAAQIDLRCAFTGSQNQLFQCCSVGSCKYWCVLFGLDKYCSFVIPLDHKSIRGFLLKKIYSSQMEHAYND